MRAPIVVWRAPPVESGLVIVIHYSGGVISAGSRPECLAESIEPDVSTGVGRVGLAPIRESCPRGVRSKTRVAKSLVFGAEPEGCSGGLNDLRGARFRRAAGERQERLE